MQIKVNTDQHIDGKQDFSDHVTNVVTKALTHFSDEITRVEVHVSDENGPKGSDKHGDKRCMIEVRLAGAKPIGVTEHGENIHVAIAGAAEKARRAVKTQIGKRREH